MRLCCSGVGVVGGCSQELLWTHVLKRSLKVPGESAQGDGAGLRSSRACPCAGDLALTELLACL